MNRFPARPVLVMAIALAAALATAFMPATAVSRTVTEAPGRDAGQERMADIKDRPEMLMIATSAGVLVRIRMDTPDRRLGSLALSGLAPDERLVGFSMDKAEFQPWALSSQGRLLKIDLSTARAEPVGPGLVLPPSASWTVDVDGRSQTLRAISDTGVMFRASLKDGTLLGPMTGEPPAYLKSDLMARFRPRVVSLAHRDAAAGTVHFVIDAENRHLANLGSAGSARPRLPPETGRLHSIGPLSIRPFDGASLDMTPQGTHAYLITTRRGEADGRLYELDLATGQAALIGPLVGLNDLAGLVVEP